jgi:hypothetical protein
MSGILGMSDEEVLNMDTPPEYVKEEETEFLEPVVLDTELTTEPDVVALVEEPAVVAAVGEDLSDEELLVAVPPVAAKEEKAQPLVDPSKPVTPDTPVTAETNGEKPPEVAIDYEGFYKKAMAPFRANGKEIQLKSPEELMQLVKMGANYTRKMQDIAPHRKVLLMLENNGLLDEGKLSYLIDLDKKNPDAIKKLIADSGIDPLDIDTTTPPAYTAGNHRVTDEESAFRSTLDELSSNEEGVATLQAINSTWDQASKEQLYKSPEIMDVMVQQRKAGFYDRIVTEMERQRTLGAIPAGQSWLQSYKQVGDQLVAVNGFADLVEKPALTTQTVAQAPTPVATRVATAKPTVAHNDKANAAAPTRVTPQVAKVIVNPLSVSDDEFLKQMQNRL